MQGGSGQQIIRRHQVKVVYESGYFLPRVEPIPGKSFRAMYLEEFVQW